MASTAEWLLRGSLAILVLAFCVGQCYQFVTRAYTIRLHAINEYGYIIHEFDPWFNFRAAQYLHDNGWKAFVNWFDHKVWYPLGRPVGTTIYPGMQVIAVWLTKSWLPVWFGVKKYLGMSIPKNVLVKGAKRVSKSLSSPFMSMVASSMSKVGMKWVEMSLNDVCCLIPAWFGALTTVTTGLIALECSARFHCGVGSQFGTILDEFPLLGHYLRKVGDPIRYILKKYSGLDAGGVRVSSSSALQPASLLSMTATMFFMSTIPAHIMRSVGGGYDNESVAVFAMTLVFYLWTRSLRGDGKGADVDINPSEDNVGYRIRQKEDVGFSLSTRTITAAFWGALTGVAYFNMAAAWGGYTFVINLVGVHAAALVILGRHSSKLHAAYSAFYIVGTTLATRVPVVGLTPIKSLEQMGPMLVFFVLQLLEYCERVRTRDNLTRAQTLLLRIRLAALFGVVGTATVMSLYPSGHFGPISARVRGLFVPHTKTGNPLVDSVAEHQAAKEGTYEQYLGVVAKFAHIGLGMIALAFTNDASSFLVVYGLAAYYFSHKMVRLILLTAPIGSILVGMVIGRVLGFCVEGVCGFHLDIWEIFGTAIVDVHNEPKDEPPAEVKSKRAKSNGAKKTKEKSSEKEKGKPKNEQPKSSIVDNIAVNVLLRCAWAYLAYYLYTEAQPEMKGFGEFSDRMAVAMSHPTILFKGNTRSGGEVLVDDYREAYWWLRDNTPEDARIMAWWDYGYQITGIANRTTIADGNTWNHEHIALLGRALTSPLKEGHRIARHLADYVLLWTGGGGDDLAKSPHLARIANSVYRDMCPNDPTCSRFSMPGGRPSQMMRNSLLYRLHSHQLVEGVEADKNRFKEVYRTKYGKVRIYKILSVSKESKEWVKKNKMQNCDAGGWFCPGNYPPGLQKVLKEKKDFAQLEDFNRGASDEEYQKQYFENLNDPAKARRRAKKDTAKEVEPDRPDEREVKIEAKPGRPTKEEIRDINRKWVDNEITNALFDVVRSNDLNRLALIAEAQELLLHSRSKDGRGPMWWAHEFGRKDIIEALKDLGVSDKLKDGDGILPADLADDRDEF